MAISIYSFKGERINRKYQQIKIKQGPEGMKVDQRTKLRHLMMLILISATS